MKERKFELHMKIMDVINITSMKNAKVFTKLVFCCGLFESVTTMSHYKLWERMWTLLFRLSSDSFGCFQSTKSNCDITSRDQKQHRWSQKWTLEPFFQTKCNVETSASFTSLLCRSDSPQPTPTTLLPPSDAVTDDAVPATTTNRVRKIWTSIMRLSDRIK